MSAPPLQQDPRVVEMMGLAGVRLLPDGTFEGQYTDKRVGQLLQDYTAYAQRRPILPGGRDITLPSSERPEGMPEREATPPTRPASTDPMACGCGGDCHVRAQNWMRLGAWCLALWMAGVLLWLVVR